jgi:hypothetical protein
VAKKEKRDVLIPHKFLSIFETLAKQGKDKQATELIIAIIRFDMTGEEPIINDDGVSFVWESVIKPQLEENIQKYKEVSKARSEAVGNRYKQDNTNATNEYNCSNSNQKNNENTIATDIDVDVDVDIDNDSELKEKINKKEKPQKHKHGQYQNVLLSDDELEKLNIQIKEIEVASIQNDVKQDKNKSKEGHISVLNNLFNIKNKNNSKPIESFDEKNYENNRGQYINTKEEFKKSNGEKVNEKKQSFLNLLNRVKK